MVEMNLISPYYKRSFPIAGKKFEGSHGKSQHPGMREKPADLLGSKGENMNKMPYDYEIPIPPLYMFLVNF